MMNIYYASKFERSLKKLPKTFKDIIDERADIFQGNPFDPRLKTHRLVGKLEGYWSFSLTYKHRVLFRFVDAHTVEFIDVGDHRVYR